MAIANARRAYGRCLERFAGARWDALRALGARPQRPLWASTGTKDPAYADVRYVERLIAPAVVNTMPEHTLCGRSPTTATLEREGVESFCSSYGELLHCIASKLPALATSQRA